MSSRFDRYVSAVWIKYGLVGIVVIVLLLAALGYVFGVDVGGLGKQGAWLMSKLLITAAMFALACLLSLNLSAVAADEPGCVPIGTAEGQTLYLCESDYGVSCVWD